MNHEASMSLFHSRASIYEACTFASSLKRSVTAGECTFNWIRRCLLNCFIRIAKHKRRARKCLRHRRCTYSPSSFLVSFVRLGLNSSNSWAASHAWCCLMMQIFAFATHADDSRADLKLRECLMTFPRGKQIQNMCSSLQRAATHAH